MSEKKENFIFACLWLISCVAGVFAYVGADRIRWVHNDLRELLPVGVGLAVMMLVMRGLCGFIEDWEEHRQNRAEEQERFKPSSKQQEEENESGGWEKQL
jgi:hypothetical protein